MNTDIIQKKILLHAPRKRIWRALSDSTEFGSWFGVDYNNNPGFLTPFDGNGYAFFAAYGGQPDTISQTIATTPGAFS